MFSIDFNYYKIEYMGVLIKDEAEFDRLIKQQVRPRLNKITFGRIDNIDVNDIELVNKVKDAFCSCVDLVKGHLDVNGTTIVGTVSSESVGPWHRTYATPNVSGKSTDETLARELSDKVYYYLGDTGLMFGGV